MKATPHRTGPKAHLNQRELNHKGRGCADLNPAALAALREQTVDREFVATVGELIDHFMAHAETHYTKNVGRNSSSQYLQFRVILGRFRSLAGDLNPDQINAALLGRWIQALADTGQWGRKRVNKHLSVVTHVLKWGVSQRLCSAAAYAEANATPGIRPGRTAAGESEGVDPISSEVYEATLPQLGPVLRALVQFIWHTGCRTGEAVILRPADLTRLKDVTLYTPTRHKTQHHGHRRLILVPPAAATAIQPFVDATPSPETFVFRPSEQRHDRRTDLTRDHYSTDSVRRGITRACKRAGIEPWTPHRMRHAAARRFRTAHGREIAAKLLGHKTLSMVDLYARDDADDLKLAIEAIGGAADVAETGNMLPVPSNARQAEALAKAPAADRPEVWAEVVEESETTGKPITAKAEVMP